MLASSSLQSFVSSPGHANTVRFFPAHRRPCWRRPPRKAFVLRRVTPTWSGFSLTVGAHVGAVLPAKSLSSVRSRQHGPDFPELSAPMLAPSSLQSLCPLSGHANTVRIFPAHRCSCWRRPPRKALFLRRVTPTPSGFSRLTGAHVGAVLPAKLCFFAGSRQHGPDFPGSPAPMLAPSSPQSLCPPPGHANTVRIFPAHRCSCWRRPPCKAFVLRHVTPTWSGFSRTVGAHVGAVLPAKPLSSVRSRQHSPDFSELSAPMLASSSPQSFVSSPGHANTVRIFPAHRRPCWRPGMKNLHPESNLSLTMRLFSDAGLFFC